MYKSGNDATLLVHKFSNIFEDTLYEEMHYALSDMLLVVKIDLGIWSYTYNLTKYEKFIAPYASNKTRLDIINNSSYKWFPDANTQHI